MPSELLAQERELGWNAIHARGTVKDGRISAPFVGVVRIFRTTSRDTETVTPIDDGVLVEQTTSGWIAPDRDAPRRLILGTAETVRAAAELPYSEDDDRAVDRLMKRVRDRRKSGSRKISRKG